MTDHPSSHPGLDRLDEIRAGGGSEADKAHVDACELCRAQLEDLHHLATAFRGVATPKVEVPKDVDARILWNARKRARLARRRPYLRTLVAGGSAAAAAVLLLLTTSDVDRHPKPPQQVAGATARNADTDGNGIVDIRDAFLVARELSAGRTLHSAWDLDGDTSIDRSDIEAIARRAVAVGGRG